MKWFAVTGLAAAVMLSFIVWRFAFGEVFSPALRGSLKPGMTTNQVLAILGPPSAVSNGDWIYTRPLMFNVGLVFFDDSGHLTSAVND